MSNGTYGGKKHQDYESKYGTYTDSKTLRARG